MERCNKKAQASAAPRLIQSSDARYFAPVDQFRLEDELAICDSSFQLPEAQSQHADGIRARIPRIACYTVTLSGRQKTAAGLNDHHRQRHTKLCPQLGGTLIPALASLLVFVASFILKSSVHEVVLLTKC